MNSRADGLLLGYASRVPEQKAIMAHLDWISGSLDIISSLVLRICLFFKDVYTSSHSFTVVYFLNSQPWFLPSSKRVFLPFLWLFLQSKLPNTRLIQVTCTLDPTSLTSGISSLWVSLNFHIAISDWSCRTMIQLVVSSTISPEHKHRRNPWLDTTPTRIEHSLEQIIGQHYHQSRPVPTEAVQVSESSRRRSTPEVFSLQICSICPGMLVVSGQLCEYLLSSILWPS